MNCSEVREKLIDYIGKDLDEIEYNKIKKHIENCNECNMEYEKTLETIKNLQKEFESIGIPDSFMNNVKNNVNKPKKQRFRITKSLRIGFIIIAIIIIFTITCFADLNGDLKWWKDYSLKESKSINELISNGYGEHVNISSTDKNIKITIESVVADDTETVMLYKIEDLNKKNKYFLNGGIAASGEFNLPDKKIKDPFISDVTLYNEIPYIQKGILDLYPVKNKNSEINIQISKIYFDKNNSTINGVWKFKVPVKKYESKTYALNKEVEVDGNSLKFDEIKISPVTTELIYSFNRYQNSDYEIVDFHFKLIGNGKIYEDKYNKPDLDDKKHIVFDTMYFDNPDKIKIEVAYYTVVVNKLARYDIDVNKPFPQIYKYYGSRISIDSIKIGDKKTEVVISKDNKYEDLNFQFFAKGCPYVRCTAKTDGYIIDKKGKKFELDSMLGTTDKMIEPKTYTTKYYITLEDLGFLDKKYEVGKLIPIQFNIESYWETRYVNKSFTIKLNK